MTTPVQGRSSPAAASMTPERWREVDAILQSALASEPARREAVVLDACRGDETLRREVASLLAVYVEGDDFLERPPAALGAALPEMRADLHAAPRASEHLVASGYGPRVVSARSALYAAVAMLVVGLAVGVHIGRSSLLPHWTAAGPAAAGAAAAQPVAGGDASVAAGGDVLAVVDRAGRTLRVIPAQRPWTPRFSRDGRSVAYGAFGGRETSDLWVTDLDVGTTRRITDDDADDNDPQWSADGTSLAYSASAPGGKDLMLRPLGGGEARVLAARKGTQFPSDWLRDGSALLVTEDRGSDRYDILVQPADGSAARPYAASPASETAARISPDGHWVAYTSDESGRAEVYLDSYPRPGRRIAVSSRGGLHPVWRGDGAELYYWRDGELVAVKIGKPVGGAAPALGEESVLFRAPYHADVNTMYDVSPDGQRFVIVRQP